MQNMYLGTGSKRTNALTPETLYKRSNLFLDPTTNGIVLQGSYSDDTFEPNADAECAGPGLHISSPSRFCTCGFYAYKEYLDALNHPKFAPFILQVVASGKMLEYDKGYRFGHQRVTEVTVTSCGDVNCKKSPDRLMVSHPSGQIIPACSYHSGEGNSFSTLSFSEFEEKMSASLPPGTPPVRIFASGSKTAPWVRQNKPLRQMLTDPGDRSELLRKVSIGLAVTALGTAIANMVRS